jgi:hypothetical protein
MTMDMLQHLARSRLPVTVYSPAEIDQIKRLRKAGLIFALTPAPSNPMKLSGEGAAAQVLAITPSGRDELGTLDHP